MSAKFDFTGKVVLITGSSSGIGAATAVQFSQSGANVVVTGRNQQKVQEVAKQCLQVSPNKSKALEVVADVTIEADMTRLVNETIKHFGRLDILVNNAGAGIIGPITHKDYYKTFQNCMKINLNSCVFMTHICVEYLEKTKGNIINISSVGGKRALKDWSPYNMAKCAMDMFTKCMASELASKSIRVNVINSGPIVTNFMVAMGLPKQSANTLYDNYGPLVPLGRCGTSQDIAHSILYMASDQASFITGSGLVSDGGCLAANMMNSDIKNLI